MLEKLLIQNFQAHSKTSINFDPEITCIIGPSDSGKSAIIRALRWACCNAPGNSLFVRHGAKGTTVKLLVDGKTITRKRSSNDTTNEYWLDKERYKSFGRNIPEPVLNVLNIDPISWQNQHDSPYWFNSTAGEVSRQLNAIVDLSVIDSTLSAIARAVNKSATSLEVAEASETKAKTDFGNLQWVPEYSKEVEVLKFLGKDAVDKRKKSANIISIVDEATNQHAAMKKYEAASKSGAFLIQKGKKALNIQQTIQVLNDLIIITNRASQAVAVTIPSTASIKEAIKKYRISIDNAIMIRKLIKEVKSLSKTAKTKIPDIKSIENIVVKFRELENRAKTIRNLIAAFKEKETEVSSYHNTIELIKKEMPEICPTCSQPLK